MSSVETVTAASSFTDLRNVFSPEEGVVSWVGRKVSLLSWGALYLLGIALVTATVVPPMLALYYRKSSKKKYQTMVDELASNRLDAVQKSIRNYVGSSRISQKTIRDEINLIETEQVSKGEKEAFGDKLIQLCEFTKIDVKADCLHEHMQKVRELLNEIVSSPCFEHLSETGVLKGFIQAAIHGITSEAEGMGPMKDLGKNAFRQIPTNPLSVVQTSIRSYVGSREISQRTIREEIDLIETEQVTKEEQVNEEEQVSEKKAFGDKLIQLCEFTKRNATVDCPHEHMQKVRDLLNEIVSSPCFGHLSETGVLKGFIQAALEGTGQAASGSTKLQSLATKIESAVESYPVFHKNSFGKVCWAYAHPIKTFHSHMDHRGTNPGVDYNSYEHGNAAMKVGSFSMNNGCKLHLVLNPTMLCDSLIAHDALAGNKHHVMTLESSYHGHEGEKERVEAQKKLAEIAPGLTVKNAPINPAPSNFKPDIDIEAREFTEFNQRLEQKLKEQTALSEKRRERAILLAKVSLGNIMEIQTLLEKRQEVYIHQPCKQNIDRGVVVNVMTILLADCLGGKELENERIYEVLGMILGRAGMVDDRAIIEKWKCALTDLLGVFDEELIGITRGMFPALSGITFTSECEVQGSKSVSKDDDAMNLEDKLSNTSEDSGRRLHESS